jgi:hypothetical protein
MKKGTKLADTVYSLEIKSLTRKPAFTSEGSSLRELVRLVSEIVPSMDTHSKVYREMRDNVGVYMGLFVLPVQKKKPRHVVVTITTNNVSEADYERFYARALTLPPASSSLWAIDKE